MAQDRGRGAKNTGDREAVSPIEDTHPLSTVKWDAQTDRIGGFVLTHELGKGGSSRVYSAVEDLLCREVAVKVLRNDEGAHRRFVREAQILAKLEHPGIVPIYRIGETKEGSSYIAMRLLRGESLATRLKNRASDGSDLPGFLKIFESICQTMAYAHSQEIVHRDLKPANVMVGEFGTVTVVDWGLAKDLTGIDDDISLTQTHDNPVRAQANVDSTQDGTVFGTIQYVPGEQARGELGTVDKRADVFTLGGILCEILTGEPPYAESTFRAAFQKAREGDVSDAYARLDQVRGDGRLVELCRACLKPQAADRLADASHVARVIQSILESAVRDAQTDLARFFELSLDMFCIAGLDGYFRHINANFTRVLGITEQELLSQPFMDFIYEPDREPTIAAMSRLGEGLPVVRFRNRYVTADQQLKHLEWTAKAIPNEDVIYAVARDVSSDAFIA